MSEKAAVIKGHGHVTPNADGYLARCGGPTICKVCKAELAALKAQPSGVVLSDEELWSIRNQVAIHQVLRDDDSVKICVKHGRAIEQAVLARLNSTSVSAGEYGDAYQGAREDLAIWKRRALEAGAKIREQDQIIENLGNALNAESGPTFMGEPVLKARAALSAPSHGEQVREGWQLVPVEPTREMISAASGAITTPDDLPPVGVGGWSMSDLAFRSRYRAAIAAAPSAGSQEQG